MGPFRENKIVIVLLAGWYSPIIFSALRSRKRAIIEQDLNVMNNHTGLKYGFALSLAYHLTFNKYYRNVLYIRLGMVRLWSILYPKEKSFFPCENIGGGIYLAHPYSTILNARSIGSNFSCRQCTTIGNKRDGDGRNNSPIIGDNVTVGANVCIIGDITIGNNVIIGAGSVVVKDVPDSVVVAGNPAKVIRSI